MHILLLLRRESRKHERGILMVTLSVGLVVLIVMVVWASYTPEGTWLVYFDSLAETEHSEVEAKEDVIAVRPLMPVSKAEGQTDRIIDLPNESRSKIGVPR